MCNTVHGELREHPRKPKENNGRNGKKRYHVPKGTRRDSRRKKRTRYYSKDGNSEGNLDDTPINLIGEFNRQNCLKQNFEIDNFANLIFFIKQNNNSIHINKIIQRLLDKLITD